MNRSSVSMWFFAGDFADALRRFAAGAAQAYGTHDQVAQLVRDLADAEVNVDIYSFMTEGRSVEQVDERVRVISLGARSYNDHAPLAEAAKLDKSDLRIPHFSNAYLLDACERSGKPVMVGLASSFTVTGVRSTIARWKLVRTLNRPAFELVANHCEPATRRLEGMGVDGRKLLSWDVPHNCSPAERPAKTFKSEGTKKVFYAGSISEEKGCHEIVRAVSMLKEQGITITAEFAGSGDIAGVEELARQLGVGPQIHMLGRIDNSMVMTSFAAADIAVVPSRHSFAEGFPLTMFEAIASRTPIVCSDHPVFRPILRDRDTAMVFRQADAHGMARCIATLLNDPDLYARLSNAADHSWQLLKGPSDWRTLLRSWVLEGMNSAYIQKQLQLRADRKTTALD